MHKVCCNSAGSACNSLLLCDTRANRNFQKESTAGHVYPYFLVSMAAECYGRNERPGGTRDSRAARPNSWPTGNKLWRKHIAPVAGVYAWWRDEIPGQRFVGRVLSAPGASEAGGLVDAAAEISRGTGLRSVTAGACRRR